MSMRCALWAFLLFAGCAHRTLAGSDLDRVRTPAFISRIESEAGPKADVFRADGAYDKKLAPQRLNSKEADRRLQNKLTRGMTRFQIADRLRAATSALLPKEPPWMHTVNPASVASALQSFLVEEVPANAPDYQLLKPLGADAIVEFVVTDYGMRSSRGRAGAYIQGYGRMFFIDGPEIWRRAFRGDQVEDEVPHVDPFKVARDPALYRSNMDKLIDAVAEQFAKDLSPSDRRGSEAPPRAGELRTPTEAPPGRIPPSPPPPSDDLPAPDPE
jgi:hypothetical protein